MSDQDPAAIVANALLTISETMRAVAEAIAGYRAMLEAQGFSPTAAEHMAMEYHHVLLAQMIGGR